MELCSGCGIIAPSQSTSCTSCKAVFASPRLSVAERDDEAYWVAVHCEVRCGSCYRRTPRYHLDVSARVSCAHCGKEEAFTDDEWIPVFEHAHAVGDLSGPNPDGRENLINESVAEKNPFKAIGIELSSASFGEQSGHTFVIASPGHPLCPRCHVPLEMPLSNDSCATSTCPTCKETTPYELPGEAEYDALEMVLAEGNRTDRPPSTEASAKTWWLLFRGPSPRRAEIEKLIRFGPPETEGGVAPKHAKELASRNRSVMVFVAAIVVMGLGAVAYELSARHGASRHESETTEDEVTPKPAPKPGHATHGGRQ